MKAKASAQWRDLEQKEAQIVSQILEYLALRGCFAWLTHDARHKPVSGFEGIPDIMFLSPRRGFGAVEVKSEKGRVSKHQEEFHEKLQAQGVTVIRARSLDDVVAQERSI